MIIVCEFYLDLKINFQSHFLYPKYWSMCFPKFFFYKHYTHLKLMSNISIMHEECYIESKRFGAKFFNHKILSL